MPQCREVLSGIMSSQHLCVYISTDQDPEKRGLPPCLGQLWRRERRCLLLAARCCNLAPTQLKVRSFALKAIDAIHVQIAIFTCG